MLEIVLVGHLIGTIRLLKLCLTLLVAFIRFFAGSETALFTVLDVSILLKDLRAVIPRIIFKK